MTVPVQSPVSNHVGNGVTTTFAYTFKLLDQTDLLVTVNGVTKSLGFDYSVTGVGVEAGGTVVFVTAPASLAEIALVRNVVIKRDTDYQHSGDFESDDVNRDFDRIVMMLQDSGLATANALRFPPGDASDGYLPGPAVRALNVLGFDAAGNIVLAPTVAGDATALTLALASSSLPSQGGGMVGFKRSDTGAVARTVFAKLSERISVKDFGAVGDGVADDLAAITAAIAALGAGDDLYFPPGIYKVTGTIVMNKAARLIGVGGGISIIKTSHASLDVMQITSSNAMVADIGFEASVVRTGGYFINVISASNITIERCPLTGWYAGLGFTGDGGVHIRVRDARIGTTIAGGVGIDIATTSVAMVDGVFEDLLIGGASGTQPVASFRILQAGDVTLRHISTVYGGTGLAVTPSSGRNVQALYVTDSFFDSGNSNGVELNPQNGCAIQMVKFSNVWSATNGNGFLVTATGTGAVQKAEFINCAGVNNTAGAGLNIASTNNIDVLVMGGNYAANTHGLVVAAGVQKFKFMGVKSGASGQFGPNSGYGLVMGNNPDYFNIVDCDFNNNTTGPMSLGTLPATSGNTFWIARNQGILTQNSAAVTLNSGATTTVVNHGLPAAPKIEDISITNNGGWGAASSFWITTVTASQFTINTNVNPGAGVFIGWRARLWGA